MNELWWKQIASARDFIEQIADHVAFGKAVLLYLPEWTPWCGTFQAEIEVGLQNRNSENRLDIISCPDGDIGQYLFESYCKKGKKASYRPTCSYAQFLARNSDIVLNQRYLWVKGISEERLKAWEKFIAEYTAAVQPGEAYAGFILETASPIAWRVDSELFVSFDFAQRVTSYDSFTFCALAGAETDMPQALRPYLTEVVSTLCQTDIELCAVCLMDWKDFFRSPIERYCSLIKSGLRSNGKSFGAVADDVQLSHSLWEAQLKQLFPIIERYRSDFIQLYFHEIEALLPVSNRLGEDLSTPQDVELGILYYWVLHEQIKTSNNEYHTLDFFRKMRNNLAHLNPLKSEDVYQILSYIKTAG